MSLNSLRKFAFLALLFAFLPLTSAHAQAGKVAGDWEGISADGRHLLLHFTAETPTLLTGTIDSPDQGVSDIGLSDISFKDGELSASVAMVRGLFKGKLSDDGNTLTGTFSVSGGDPKPITFTRSVAATSAVPAVVTAPLPPGTAAKIDGTWKGTLALASIELHLVLHFTTTATGVIATLDSPDQGVSGIAATSVSVAGSTLKLTGPNGGGFEGTIAGDTVTGTWTQGPHTLPLTLTRTHDAITK